MDSCQLNTYSLKSHDYLQNYIYIFLSKNILHIWSGRSPRVHEAESGLFRLLQPCYLHIFLKLCRPKRTFPFVSAFLLTNCTTAFLTKNTVTLNALYLFINSHIMLILKKPSYKNVQIAQMYRLTKDLQIIFKKITMIDLIVKLHLWPRSTRLFTLFNF